MMVNCGIIFQKTEFKCYKVNKEVLYIIVDCPMDKFNGPPDTTKLYKVRCQFVRYKRDSTKVYKLIEIL